MSSRELPHMKVPNSPIFVQLGCPEMGSERKNRAGWKKIYSKHIAITFYFIPDLVIKNIINVQCIPSSFDEAAILTNVVSRTTMHEAIQRL